MDGQSNALNWFEIPVADLERAKKFYETIFDMEMRKMEVGENLLYVFPTSAEPSGVSGAIIKDENAISSMDGITMYLNANPSIDAVIARIEDAGGKILIPKQQVSPEVGFVAYFNDSEGNRLAIHANT